MASAIPPEMSAWRKAQELTRKAEEEAMMAEKKSQEAYIWYVAGHDQFTASTFLCHRHSNVGRQHNELLRNSYFLCPCHVHQHIQLYAYLSQMQSVQQTMQNGAWC